MSWNATAERMFGYSTAEMVGASIRVLIPDDRQFEEDETLARIRRGEKVEHFETVRRRKDGSLILISLTVSPIHDHHGKIVGASKIARDITELKAAESERLRLVHENATVTEQLNKVGAVVASGLDRETIVQAVTDAATELTAAEFGAFFYNVTNGSGESYTLYTISGVPREAFAKFPMPRNTEVFEPTFRGTGVVRSDDITSDPRYGHNAPYHGMPPGHLPVRSYLAVPVQGRVGEAIGGLFFGHSEVRRFTERHERLAVGIASWASVALENAALYVSVQEASQVKDHFLATLSHELRTPLNAILGYARMLRAGMVAPDKQRRAVDIIERNATSLTQIVEDVLDVSRIVSGKLRLNVQPVDVPEVIRGAVDSLAPAADAKGVRIETVLDPRATPISGDPERLQQILWNLLSNAVKFTGRGGRVQVRLARVNSHVEVSVSDTGVGISPEFLPHIFERFRQADAGTTRERGGLGLGLAIARQLVEMHGGTIDVASGGLNQGSTFRIQLPLMILHPVQAGEPRTHPRSPSSTAAIASPDLSGLVVLAVDDDRDALFLVSEMLETAGARVLVASSAAEALALLDREPADVLVADLGMPVRRRLSADRARAQAPQAARPGDTGGSAHGVRAVGRPGQGAARRLPRAPCQAHRPHRAADDRRDAGASRRVERGRLDCRSRARAPSSDKLDVRRIVNDNGNQSYTPLLCARRRDGDPGAHARDARRVVARPARRVDRRERRRADLERVRCRRASHPRRGNRLDAAREDHPRAW